MRNFYNVPQICLLIFLNLTRTAQQVTRVQPVILGPTPGGSQQSDKPALVRPNTECQIRYVGGKRIIPNGTNPNECLRQARERAEQKKQAAAQAAVNAIKMVEQLPPKPEECIRTVNQAAQECLRAKIQKKSETKPKYVVGSGSNLVTIYDDKQPVFMATRVQAHYTKKPISKKPSEIVNKYKDVVVLNEYGNVIATKTPKSKKKIECVCPVTSIPNTTEKIISECIKTDCKTSGMITNILNNATVENQPEPEAAKPKNAAKEEAAEK
jgi:hypothetical protein